MQPEDQEWPATPGQEHLQAVDQPEVQVMMSNQGNKPSCHVPCIIRYRDIVTQLLLLQKSIEGE